MSIAILTALFAALSASVAQGSIPLAPFPELSAPRAITQGPHDHFLANYFGGLGGSVHSHIH